MSTSLFASHQIDPSPKKYRNFNLWLSAAIAAPMVSVGLFNFVIDPYDIFPTPQLEINHAKPKKDNNDRVYKAIDVIRLRPTVVFVGSSRIKLGLDPSNAAFEESEEVYNLGLNGPNFYEQLRYLEHAIANQNNIEAVVVGLDFFAFNKDLDNQPTFSEHRLEKQHITGQDVVNFTASLDVLSASSATLRESLSTPNRQDDYGDNGFTPDRYIGDPTWKFREGLRLYFELHSDHEILKKYMDNLKTLVELCRQNNIPLYLFISPSHATQWEAIRATGRWESFEQWKRDVAEIAPVWDFSGYNSITTEPVNSQSQNYTDNSHYTPLVGDLVLERMLSNKQSVPQDFGVLLTPETVEAHLAQIRQDRQEWSKQNPEVVKTVRKVQQKQQKSSQQGQ